jgi:putative nucleotidyltransferase-like protein
MTVLNQEIPQPVALEGILRKITETLAKELACPTQAAPNWSEVEWIVARAVAAMHGVSPLLSRTLRWQGPAGWTGFLEEQRAHTAKRHVRVDDLLLHLDHGAREAGVAAVALKGVALHSLGVYQAGDRPMADVDLLVRPADAHRTALMLESLGYAESFATWKERVFTRGEQEPATLGEHSNNGVKIELHERICERLPWRITDISEHVFPPKGRPGLNAYPSKASLMIHLLLHAAGGMAFQSLRLLHLHDLAQLSSQMSEEDWDAVLEAGERGDRPWWAFPPLNLTSRYFPSKIPVSVLTALADDCPYLLKRAARHRTLCDVSYSHLWVDAFPGMEWSQSLREVLGYVASRVRPNAKHMAFRAHTAKSEAWAKRSQWSRLSQSRRIMQWITTRPTRPLTMHAVHAALAQAHD